MVQSLAVWHIEQSCFKFGPCGDSRNAENPPTSNNIKMSSIFTLF